MVPPFAEILFPKYKYPMDFFRSFRGKRVFGDHKTIRGLITGILMAELLFLLQQYLYANSDLIKNISLINYTEISPFFGIALGFGGLMGDALKSFFKRQIGIKPGSSWFPWDQIDWIIGSLVLSGLFIKVTLSLIFGYLIIGLALHLLFKVIGYAMKMNQTYI